MLASICSTTECWSATGDMMAGWGALGGVLAVMYAAYKASDTFKGYRRQKQEDRRIDAAERILTLAYSFERRLAAARSPMSSGEENHAAETKLGESEWFRGLRDEQKRKAKISQVTLTRLLREKDEWDKIIQAMPIARALFGEPIEACLQTFWQQVVSVNVSADMYADDRGHDQAFTESLERSIWGAGGEEDKISAAVRAAVAELEGVLLPIIRADHT